MAVIQCPRCLQKYRVPDERIGQNVMCNRPGCSQAFLATTSTETTQSPAISPLVPPTDTEAVNDSTATQSDAAMSQMMLETLGLAVNDSTATLSDATARRLRGQELVRELRQVDAAKASDSLKTTGLWLLWIGLSLTVMATLLPTGVKSSEGGHDIHNLAKAGRQLLLALMGMASMISGSAMIAGSGEGLSIWGRVVVAGWAVAMFVLLALPVLLQGW